MTFPSPTATSYALITGASQGIGEALARELASAGYNLILVARREDVLMALADSLSQRHGVNCEVFAADLSLERDVTALIEHIGNRTVSICINSAGIASFGPFMKADWDYEVGQYNLNATAVFRITKAVLDQMVPRGQGALCNVGSAAGNMPIPNNATYVFTKAGVNTFTESLHFELKPAGVHCTLLAPGPVRASVVPEEEQTIVDKVVPDFLWTTYESCASDTLAAMRRNKRRVVPGPLSKAMDVVSTYTPRGWLSPLIGRFYSQMGEG
ncbi:mycolate reductase [Corynebacterium liangguodongii]|uniref:Short-chain dehydrogenase n=1 Tax=Corynebacterium liangguodongii TaxID=2079535 RepID=A0A2S0WFR8_9CORY|nr:mycolate reductase [Corynebacterium liangguodongii]AWB84564.1 short-chain dehydrogenase [Corynebacterium liangguodongii]PWB98852.1 SDR family NAD(P)-dependent oxidoreductase [Corynebacterium liangguodongii]